ARDLELALDGPLDLVTTSALLDLVSREWLDRLVVEVAARRLPFYAALTYDGRAVAAPPQRFDGQLLARLHLHQPTDKRLGPALGPSASVRAADRFEHFGYELVQGRSDWVFGPDDRAIQDALFAGWAELGPLTTGLSADDIAGWLAQRRAYLAAGRSNLRVGHVDIFARPIGTRWAVGSQAGSPSPPRLWAGIGGRPASAARSVGGSVRLGRPAPRINGGAKIFRGSGQRAGRNREAVLG